MINVKKTVNHGEHGGHSEKLKLLAFFCAYPMAD